MTLIPTQITFRGFPHSDALEAEIHERIDWLEQIHESIVRCRVLIELPHRHRRTGRHFHVRIELTVPGGARIVVTRAPSPHGDAKANRQDAHHKDTEIGSVNRHAGPVIRQAFDAARRQLDDFTREQRGNVKTHAAPQHQEMMGPDR